MWLPPLKPLKPPFSQALFPHLYVSTNLWSTQHINQVISCRTGHPIRFILERGNDMLITAGRHPLLGRYKVSEQNFQETA